MRILHTSDWHIGRTFFGHPTFEALAEVFDSMVEVVRREGVDVLLASGDIFDLATPSAQAFDFLDTQLVRLRQAGAQLVLTPGNHDSAARLGARRAFAGAMGVHVLTDTDTDSLTSPVTIDDVHFYGVPFLEPAVMRTGPWRGIDPMRSQRDALSHAMSLIRADASTRGGASIVLSHTFVQGADGDSCDSERDILGHSQGGIEKVPVSVFDGITYAALGHIHGRATLADHVRYSGAPLHFSFSEAAKPRGGWLVDVIGGALAEVRWADFAVPRPMSSLRGTLEELLDPANEAADAARDHWIEAVLTDLVRPVDAMAKLQTRFPYCVHLRWEPSERHQRNTTYRHLISAARSDAEIIDTFLTDVRNGVGASTGERDLIDDVLSAVRLSEASR